MQEESSDFPHLTDGSPSLVIFDLKVTTSRVVKLLIKEEEG